MDFREGIPEKYWELIDRYRAELLNQAVAILGSFEDAEDVVQETFCEAFSHVEKLPQLRSIGAWLRNINRCKAVDRVRGKHREGKAKKDSQRKIEAEKAFTTGGISALGVRETVARALETLPPNARSVVVLRYWEHLSYKEIAERLKLPVGTVGHLHHEATMMLYQKLRLYFEAPPLPPDQPKNLNQE